jgi:hypothetical protein
MKFLIYKNDDGGLSIIIPAYTNLSNVENENAFLENLKLKDVPKNINNTIRPSWIVDSGYTAECKFLRNAWSVDDYGNKIFRRSIGEELKKHQFRYLRKSLFEKLDAEFMKALENNDLNDLNLIKNKKQALRDITDIDMSQYQTPEDLHNFIPDILK